MTKRMSLAILATLILGSSFGWAQETASGAFAHKMLLVDESRSRLHFVNTANAAENWTVEFPAKYRDLQLVGDNRVMVSTDSGYAEYDLASRKKVKDVHDKQYAGTMSVRRLPDGRTIIASIGPIDPKAPKKTAVLFFELDKQDKLLRRCAMAECSMLRLFRLSRKGTLLFGCNDRVIEANLEGKVLRDVKLAGAKHIYQVLEGARGHLLVAAGYGSFVAEVDDKGNILRKWGGLPGPEGKGLHFFAGFQVLKNGNLVVCNWTGHGARDSEKGHQILEYDAKGNLLGTWHDANLAGSLVGVIVLDDLDATQFNDDSSGVLGAVK